MGHGCMEGVRGGGGGRERRGRDTHVHVLFMCTFIIVQHTPLPLCAVVKALRAKEDSQRGQLERTAREEGGEARHGWGWGDTCRPFEA